MTNRLYYGDNLEVLADRAAFPDGCVDLVYLDPPFNSNASYSHLFRAPDGSVALSQIEAFEDTWEWGEASNEAFHRVILSGHTELADLLRALRSFLKENAMMAYLAMMAVRLLELHRVLKPTGSLYLHCDPTASHYLKIVLDAVFGPQMYKTEIVWKRTFAHGNVGRSYGDVTDSIFFYTKSDAHTWNQVFTPMTTEKADSVYTQSDPGGRRWQSVTLRNPGSRPNLRFPYTASNGVTYQPHPNGWSCNEERLRRYDAEGRLQFPTKPGGALRLKMYEDESKGGRLQSLWDDVPPISSNAKERLGYPTQKPLALLERIISASSNPGDLVLDPFCGCGTAVDAAQGLGRRWAGIDITHLAVGLIERRLKDRYGEDLPYEVIGKPADSESALRLAADKPYDFQYWITFAVGGQAYQGGRKGRDRGIDGVIYFTRNDPAHGDSSTERAIISVKAGRQINPSMIRDLKGTMEREGAPMGVFICAYMPTREMEREAAAAGLYTDAGEVSYPRIQIFTLAELFQGKRPRIPLLDRATKRAPRADHQRGAQTELI